jgi:hypothetical protein
MVGILKFVPPIQRLIPFVFIKGFPSQEIVFPNLKNDNNIPNKYKTGPEKLYILKFFILFNFNKLDK